MEQWQSWSEFWAMGGAAPYVWGSYAVTALLIVIELVTVFRGRAETVRRLRRWRMATKPATGEGVQRARKP